MKMLSRMLMGLALAVTVLGFGVERASAFGFGCVTNNSATDCGIGEAQLSGDFSTNPPAGAGQVLLTLTNAGPLASSIAQVYLDDGVSALFAGIASIVNGSGVNFSVGGSPPDLPGGNTVGFTADFLATANAPVAPNGVNPGETLGIVLNLVSGKSLSDVLAELGSGDLRVGIHVQAFSSEGSESFVNGGGRTPIPEPSAALVFGLGALLVHSASRRRTA